MKRRTFVLLLLLANPDAGAASWYLRPAGVTYGAGDGASYANAWNSTTRIRWSQLASGDTLYICGMHDSGAPTDRALGAVRSNITISGACYNGTTADPGTMVGASVKIGSGNGGVAWSSGPDANGIYTYDPKAQGPPKYAMNESFQRVTMTTAPLTASTPCNTAYNEGRATTYKPCRAPGTPGTPTLYLGFEMANFIEAPAGLTNFALRDLRLYLYYYGLRVVGGSNITVSGVTMRVFSKRYNDMIGLYGLIDGVTIRNNLFCDGGNGIYGHANRYWADSGQEGWRADLHKQNNVLIENNRICEMWGDLDSHGIGMQGGNNWTVSKNYFHDIEGSVIVFYLPSNNNNNANDRQAIGPESAWTIHDARIENNVIRGTYQFPGSAGSGGHRGVEVTGHYSCIRQKGAFKRIVIRDNLLHNITSDGIYINAAQSDDGTAAVQVVGNTVDTIRDPTKAAFSWNNVLYGRCADEAATGGTSALFTLNTVRSVATAITTPNPSVGTMLVDYSQVSMTRNVYPAGAYMFWPSPAGKSACASTGGTWGKYGNYCRFTAGSLAGYRSYSAREQGSVAQ